MKKIVCIIVVAALLALTALTACSRVKPNDGVTDVTVTEFQGSSSVTP